MYNRILYKVVSSDVHLGPFFRPAISHTHVSVCPRVYTILNEFLVIMVIPLKVCLDSRGQPPNKTSVFWNNI